MTSWNPQQYLEFAEERTRPAADLLARIPITDPVSVVDLGCGTGNSTALLAARWPNARLAGLDNSESMLAEAGKSGVAATWILASIDSWTPNTAYDLIFSNAAFQWLPSHRVLLPRLMSFLTPGGAFAFQVPGNFSAPSHVLLKELASDPRWKGKLSGVRAPSEGASEAYYEILAPHSRSVLIWSTEYLHILTGEDAVYRWISGTGLRPYVNALEGSERAEFIAAYKSRLNEAYPRKSNGETLFPFRRIFAIAKAAD